MSIAVYTVPPDDGQISARNYVEVINRNKLKTNSASCLYCYTNILRRTVNKTLNYITYELIELYGLLLSSNQ
jgi:hypothetical protein